MIHGDMLDGIFNRFLNRTEIFKEREVLRHDYLPEALPHREEQLQCLGEIFAPLLKGARCSNILAYGKTGTGKTAVTKYVLGRLSQKASEFRSPVRVCYVNCRLEGTTYRVFSSLCKSVNVAVPFTGLSTGEIFNRFERGLDHEKVMFIAVLDEVDALVRTKGDVLLYELTRVNETLRHSKIALACISNDLRFKEFLDPRVLSSLSEEEIVFKPYNAAELRDILSERAQVAFNEGVLSEAALGLCAALAAAEHGDARRALDLLRVAGELAERDGAIRVEEKHIHLAERRIEHDRIFEALRNLPLHSKLVLGSIYILIESAPKRVVTGDIYGVYCELCEGYGLTPLTQRRVSSLINELDVIGLLNTQVVSMGRYGRTRKIRLGIAANMLTDMLKEDDLLRFLIKCSPKHPIQVKRKRRFLG